MLAIFGGNPIAHGDEWPLWPPVDDDPFPYFDRIIKSGRWTIRSPWTGEKTCDENFCNLFSEYCKSKYCITGPTGTLSLRLSLEALNVGFNDEVIVPALTWVAPAMAVLKVNAKPVLVDVDPKTFCINPSNVESAINSRTRAIIVVHYLAGMCDMDKLLKIAKRYQLPIIEDSAQAHGSEWNGKKAGSIGDIGVFSFHGEKLLTCGEGGAAITQSHNLYEKLQSLRLDGYSFSSSPKPTTEGEWQVGGLGLLMGSSCCLSEFQAAILLAQLSSLDRRNEIRGTNAKILDYELSGISGLSSLETYSQVTRRVYYQYPILYDSHEFNNLDIDLLSLILSKELNFPIYPEGGPIHKSILYRPETLKRYSGISEINRDNIVAHPCPVSEKAPKQLLLFHHRILLNKNKIQKIIDAISKVKENMPFILKHKDELQKQLPFDLG